MSESKKTTKSELVSKDESEILNDCQIAKTNLKKKPQKRQKPEVPEGDDEDFSELIGMFQANAKKNKTEPAVHSKQTRQKLLDVMSQQFKTRNNLNENFIKSLLDIIKQLETDYEALRENEHKLEHLANVFVKCIKQTSAAQKQNLKALKDIHTVFQQECEQLESYQKVENNKLAIELEEDMNKLQQQFVAETKRKQFENLRRTIFHAIQNDLVEGLITRGGMKPDDRPLWFDVYRAFPPLADPKFARPKPEIKPLRQILYKEDLIRAKFHSKGHGLGAVNMLNPIGDTQTKRLVQQYEKLETEGVPESELIEKAVSAVGIERQQQYESRQQEIPKTTPKNPNSVTAQVLAEADLKNIFKEEK